MNVDPASFAMGRNPAAVQQRFAALLGPAVGRLVGTRLTREEAQACLREAALASGTGRFVLGHNYWMLPGRGDRGAFILVRLRRDYGNAGGYTPVIETYAKFSNVNAAVDAWCRRRGK